MDVNTQKVPPQEGNEIEENPFCFVNLRVFLMLKGTYRACLARGGAPLRGAPQCRGKRLR